MPNTQTSVPAFTAGQVLTAAQMTEVNTGIPVFATTTTRDAAFGGTGEKTLAEGQFAYIEASNATQYYDGAAWQTVGGGLTFVKAQTIGSAVSSVTVSDAFSATYDNYRIVINGGVSSASDGLRMTLGATATGYYWALVGRSWAGVAVTNEGANQTSFYVGDITTTSFHIVMDVTAPNLAKATALTTQSLAVRTDGYSESFSGYLNNSTQYTAFTLTPATGGTTITGGTIRLYGYQNS